MSKKFNNELLELDLYEILELNIDADEKAIKKAFRKKALACHPDKNPDNPDAADQFNKLKRILEIFLDPGARRAYDKVLKGRKVAALRLKETHRKNQKLKLELEEREKAAYNNPKISEEERLKREIKRLEEEGEKLIAEELESLNKEATQSECNLGDVNGHTSQTDVHVDCRVKARWKSTDDGEGYTKEEIHQLFYKWGEINAIVVKTKGLKNTALIEFKDETGANMAVQFEKGLGGKPIEVSRISSLNEKDNGAEKLKKKNASKESRDFESVAAMQKRREAERQKLIADMLKENL